MDEDGGITIPPEIRDRLGLVPGAEVEIWEDGKSLFLALKSDGRNPNGSRSRTTQSDPPSGVLERGS